MSELQSDDSGITFEDDIEQEAQVEESNETKEVESSDLAPDSPEEGKENTGEDTSTPEWFQKKINKQTFAQRQAERERDEARKEAEALRKRYESAEPENVSIPPIPDAYDDDYEQKIRDRDEAILRKAKNDSIQEQRRETTARQQQERERADYERSQTLQKQFLENSKKLGVDSEQLSTAQDTVIEYGVTPELAMTLLEDSSGPLMVQYLAANPLDLYDIVNASPVKAGLMLAEVKSKALSLKPKPSNAPSPATRLDGRASPQKERGPKGATFE